MDISTIKLDNIPKVMKELPCWTVWSDGKVPYNAKFTDQRASSTDSNSWSSLSQALTRLDNATPFRKLYGLQYALLENWVGIDLDDCINEDRSLKPWALDIMTRINSYTEVSPSGKGLKIFLKATRPIFTHRKKMEGGGEFECYTKGKLFTVTTLHMPGTPIEVADREEEWSSVYQDYLYREGEDTPPPAPEEMSVSFEDQGIIDKIRQSKIAARFNELYTGEYGEGDSDADFELAGMICFYTNDVDQVIRIMMSSELVREKWIKKDYYYLRLTIGKRMGGEKYSPAGNTDGEWMSMGRQSSPVPPSIHRPAVAAPLEIPQIVIPAAQPPVGGPGPMPQIPNPFAVPAANVRPQGEEAELALITDMLDSPVSIQAYYDAAPDIVKRLTVLLGALNDKMPASLNFFSAMALVNGAAGKKLCTVNKGTMLYAPYWNVCLASTGLGKSTMQNVQKAIRRVLTSRGNRAPFKFMPDKFTMSSLFSTYGEIVGMKTWEPLDDVAQSQLEDELILKCEAKQARMTISDEFGHMLGAIISSGPNSNPEKGNLLKLADSGTTITGDTSTKGVRAIYDVCTSFVAYSQPEVWQDNFNPEEHLDSGLAGRFIVVSQDDFDLTVETIDAPFKKVLQDIEGLFSELLTRLDRIADRVENDPPNPDDERGRIFDEVAATPAIDAMAKHGFIDLVKLKGKLIGQALKLTQMHVFLDERCDLCQLVGAPKVAAHDSVLPQAPPRHSHSLNQGDEPVEDEQPRLTYAETTALYDTEVYRNYLTLVTTTAIKAFNCKPAMSNRERLQDKAVRILKRAGCKDMLASRLRNRSTKWKLGGRELGARDFISEVIQPACECGKLTLVSQQGEPFKVALGNTAEYRA